MVTNSSLKKTHGIVFTPYSLINEKLDGLPNSVWSNPSLKWLDPAVGSGNYMMVIRDRLMIGLASWEPDEQKRLTHIFTNMLYMVELLEYQCFLALRRLDPSGKQTLNIVCDDSLTHNFGGMRFDIVVGNPPYDNNGASNKLWVSFVKRAMGFENEYEFPWVTDGGYLVFVHPLAWRTYDSSLFINVFQKWNLISATLNIPKKTFDAGTLADYYILQKSPNEGKSIITSGKNTCAIDTRQIHFIPTEISEETISILKKFVSNDVIEIRTSTSHSTTDDAKMSRVKTDNFNIPIYNIATQPVWWSSKTHPWQTTKKILMTRPGHMRPFYDDGTLGASTDCYGVFVADEVEANYIIKLLTSKLYTFYIFPLRKMCGGFNDIKFMRSLPYPKNLPANFTDADLYTHFRLTDREITLVENFK